MDALLSIVLYPTRLIGIADWVTITTGVLIGLYIYGTSTYDHWLKRGVPAVHAWIPFIGTLPHLIKYGMIGSDEHLYKVYGRYWGAFLGRRPLLIIADPHLAKQICVKEFSNFVNHKTDDLPMAPVAEKFLSTLKDDEWRGVRNVVTPTFSGAKMKALVPTIIDCAEQLVASIGKMIDENKEFEIKDIMGQYTMDAVGATLFGFNVNAGSNAEFTLHAKRAFSETTDKKRMTLLMMCMAIPGLYKLCNKLGIYFMGGSGSFSNKVLFEKDPEHWVFFIKCVEHLIKARNAGDAEARKRVDFLALLLDAHKNNDSMQTELASSLMDNTSEIAEENKQKWNTIGKKELSHMEIVSNAMLFFLAGYETTASATSFALYLLALNEDKQQLLREEVDEAWNNNKGRFTYDQIASMQYLDAVFNETLRLYPPASRTDRVCTRDCTIDNFEFKKDDWIMFSVWALHHSDKYWTDPMKFEPERFLPENKDSIVPYSFLPFGLGPRNCVGQRLAYLEAKIALCCVLRHYTLHRNAKTEVPLVLKKASNLTGTKNGIYLDVKKRAI